MRAIQIYLFFVIFILSGCASVEVAREVTKATKSVKQSIEEFISPEEEIIEEIENQKQEVVVEKQKEKELVIKQQKITTINFLGKTLNQIIQEIGNPTLIRKDGNTQTVRFDSNNCRLFIYYKLNIEKPRAEHYEIRNIKGNLIEKKNNINKCFEEIKNS